MRMKTAGTRRRNGAPTAGSRAFLHDMQLRERIVAEKSATGQTNNCRRLGIMPLVKKLPDD